MVPGRLDLVEAAGLVRLDLGEQAVVGPGQVRIQHPRRLYLPLRRRTLRRTRGLSRFVTQCVMNLGTEQVRVGEIEQAHVPQVGRREAAAEDRLEPGRELSDQLLPVAGVRLASLLLLDDLTADEPVGPHHLGIDRTCDLAAGLVEDRLDPLQDGRWHLSGADGWGRFFRHMRTGRRRRIVSRHVSRPLPCPATSGRR